MEVICVDDQDISFNMTHGCFTYRVAALVIKNNKLLLAKSEDYPHYYTIGGKVRLSETSEEAVIREAFEETGINFEIDKLVFVQERFFEIDGQKYHEVVFFYLMKDTPNINILDNSYMDQDTKETLHWFEIANLSKVDIVPEFIMTQSFDSLSGIQHIVTRD